MYITHLRYIKPLRIYFHTAKHRLNMAISHTLIMFPFKLHKPEEKLQMMLLIEEDWGAEY